jgi:hypothetical protein
MVLVPRPRERAEGVLKAAWARNLPSGRRPTQLDVSLTGSGVVQAGAFAAEYGSTKLIGSGDAEVNYTTDQVTTTVVGSGNLKRKDK